MLSTSKYVLPAVLFGLLCSTATAAPPAATEKKPKAADRAPARTTRTNAPDDDEPAAEKPAAANELSPAMIALRDRIRRTLAGQQKQAFNLRDNSPSDLLHFCLAFGCETEVYQPGAGNQKLNAITALCWSYACGGQELLTVCDGRIAARVGYGLQEEPCQFLAMLALARVAPDYPVRAGSTTRTVADLVEFEKLSCRKGADQPQRLIALGYYAPDKTWKDGLGATWSVERMVAEELGRPMSGISPAVAQRLMGLSMAVDRRLERKRPIEGDYRRAQDFVAEYQAYALRLQNGDGSWGQASYGRTRDTSAQLFATGYVLEWLAFSLPEKRLQEPQVVRGIEYLESFLNNQRYQWNAPALGSRDLAGLCHAIHALAIYDDRVFKAEEDEKPAEKAAKKSER